ncbi:MAG: hypothetical protein GTN35_03470 [Nitrososphaeria archaeon]|nr:hypothetical protein [Nitrosopumilaceae archaeon]NIP09075.1 hypothetical protein [Nitrosopumilaceae archaeon]NIP91444.1 hypothetical protein [Nitrososphaeria archaeon]NIS95271.1 hypothetical protein [Nitrosopumilaceae archaeon]
MDETDDLEAKKCPACNRLMIKQEFDLTWFCENCDQPHGKERASVEEINFRKCTKCGKDSGIFDLCIECRPKD